MARFVEWGALVHDVLHSRYDGFVKPVRFRVRERGGESCEFRRGNGVSWCYVVEFVWWVCAQGYVLEEVRLCRCLERVGCYDGGGVVDLWHVLVLWRRGWVLFRVCPSDVG